MHKNNDLCMSNFNIWFVNFVNFVNIVNIVNHMFARIYI